MQEQAQRRCGRCGNQLSNYNTGPLCFTCTRSRPMEPHVPAVPEHLWSDPDVRSALVAWDFGRASSLIRLRGSLRQDDLAQLTGLSQAFLSMLEAGSRRLTNIDKIVPLGYGHIHGDAYPGNTLWDAPSVRLGDWDEAAIGPREIDLANTFQGVRFGRSARELDDFSLRYGYDIQNWSGLPVLCGIRDLHTLGSFIRRADRGDEDAAGQLNHRIATLMNEDNQAQWGAA